ncbi:MAG TPA: polysaccharide pyruvyl transferase CsaB [Coleofasciculaceae cyanobacterium]|jgi:polysaccharide pyruvyl transferase CsaB
MTTKKQNAKRKKKSGSGLHPRVMISGYYGFDNLGDELILRVLVEQLKEQNIKVTVLSGNPAKTASMYAVDALRRTSLIDIIDALTQTNLFISGGGGLFQDATGPMSAIYYGGLIHMADFFEVPVCFWAQGVGPLGGRWPRRITSGALTKCEVVTVRDEKSASLVEELTGSRPEITADPVWLLKLPKKKNAVKSGKKSGKEPPLKIGVSLRPWPDLTPERMKALAHCLGQYAAGLDRPAQFQLLPFQTKEDTGLLRVFSGLLAAEGQTNAILVEPDHVIETIGTCDVLFGMRFHSLILGLLYDIPVYGLVYDPKVASLLEMFGLPGTPIRELTEISPDGIRSALDNYPVIDLKPMKKQSRRNFAILHELLEIPEAELVL